MSSPAWTRGGPIPILLTVPHLSVRVSGRAVLNLVQRLDRERFAPTVGVLRRGELDGVLEALGIPLLILPFTVPAEPPPLLLVRAWQAARSFRAHRFALWHSSHYLDDFTEPLIARMAGARCWIYTKKNMSWGGRGWQMRTRMAHGIIAQNTEMVNRFFGGFSRPIALIPRGVDMERFSLGQPDAGLRRSWGFPPDAVIFAHVGQMLPRKNQEHILCAIPRSGPRAAVVFAGDTIDAAYRDRLVALARDLGVMERVRFLGKVTDIPRLLRTVDGFVFSSHQEGAPVAVLEAMAAGLPSVVTANPELTAIHHADETGLICPVGDSDAFGVAMQRLSADQGLRTNLGLAARALVSRRYSIEREVRDHEAFYLEALGLRQE